MSEQLGLFYTTGFQEDHKARLERRLLRRRFHPAGRDVLEERLALLDYALENYDDGLLFFYFSSSDLQSHMLWWDSDEPAPHTVRCRGEEVLRATSAGFTRGSTP